MRKKEKEEGKEGEEEKEEEKKDMGLELGVPKFSSQISHLLARRSWAIDSVSGL